MKQLEELEAQARRNGVDDVHQVTDVQAMEPNVHAEQALYSPSTGIVDVPTLVATLTAQAIDAGVIMALKTKVTGMRMLPGGTKQIQLALVTDGTTYDHEFDYVINCAGLQAIHLAHNFQPELYSIPTHVAKGHYFRYQPRTRPFQHLIYPIPECLDGLGIHSTMDLNGTTRFGPNVDWVPAQDSDYHVDERFRGVFLAKIRSYFPSIKLEHLVPDYAGIRPKHRRDFEFHGEAMHGVHGLMHLLGVESPGLTASLAIADHVFDTLIH